MPAMSALEGARKSASNRLFDERQHTPQYDPGLVPRLTVEVSVSDLTATAFGDQIADRISAEHVAISVRWLERLRGLLTVEANEVFPTEQLLDHIPRLIQDVADYIRSPETQAVAANTSITAKARELGQLRHAQRASVHQLLAEYRLLGNILTSFVKEELERIVVCPSAAEAIEVLRRLNDAVWILMQTTVDTFVSEYTATIDSHAGRLESFNRMVSHELRQPLGTLMYAVPLLKAEADRGDMARHDHFLKVMERNVVRLTQLMEQLEGLSRLTSRGDAPDVQRTDVASVVWEVARQLREMADARAVEIQVGDGMPSLVIDMARLELILMNLISNAIKYCDPAKADRIVRIESVAAEREDHVGIMIRDNGIGIPQEHLSTIFRRFVRAHAAQDAELGVRGSGLGLAIAAECVEAVGGSIRVESKVGEGSCFLVTVPRDARYVAGVHGSL
jgi:signal transduction histidine kinase